MDLHTFSIVAFDEATGELGVAVTTARPCVGAVCPYAQAHIGAIASQAFVNPYLGIFGLHLLEAGASADDALARLVAADPGQARRQLHMVDSAGRVAAHTGADCVEWCGHRLGQAYSVAGNMLTGEAVVDAVAAAFESSTGDLADRLLAALQAGQNAGGDKRGRQSAALRVVHNEAYPMFDVRVDDHRDPVPELRRVTAVFREQWGEFFRNLPKREDLNLDLHPDAGRRAVPSLADRRR